jgi:hypothetical protein
MIRSFSTKPKIPVKILYDDKGEKVVLRWSGLNRFLKISSLTSIGYLYFLYQLDRDTLLGSYTSYSLPMFALCTLAMFNKFSKFLYRLVLLEGGYVVKLEKYPFGGWGHLNKINLAIDCIEGIIPYGTKKWYNPFRLGKGFFRLKFQRTRFGIRGYDYVIFKIPKDYDKDLLKIISIGKPVTEQNLKMLKKL